MKVYIVHEIVERWPGEYPKVFKIVGGVFDSEEKAVDYIRKEIRDDHEYMENCELNFERDRYVRHEFYEQEIIAGNYIVSYEYFDETVSYCYEGHEVE
jgi:hypothetical protein